jgi:hypothetical protein
MADELRIDRRTALGGLAGTLTAAAAAPANAAAPRLKFFTAKEYAILEELAELIIPADDVSGGARAAGVAAIIDTRLAESLDKNERQSWRDDLEELDGLCAELTGTPFLAASMEQKTRLLDHVSQNEREPSKDGEYAFGTIKWTVSDVYYRTRIGIHDDLKYQGNVMLDEFVGTDVAKK